MAETRSTSISQSFFFFSAKKEGNSLGCITSSFPERVSRRAEITSPEFQWPSSTVANVVLTPPFPLSFSLWYTTSIVNVCLYQFNNARDPRLWSWSIIGTAPARLHWIGLFLQAVTRKAHFFFLSLTLQKITIYYVENFPPTVAQNGSIVCCACQDVSLACYLVRFFYGIILFLG